MEKADSEQRRLTNLGDEHFRNLTEIETQAARPALEFWLQPPIRCFGAYRGRGEAKRQPVQSDIAGAQSARYGPPTKVKRASSETLFMVSV